MMPPATSDPAAVNDDGTCDFSCYGCTDANACNYDADATINDGSCVSGTPQSFEMTLLDRRLPC